jgi:glycosyltransferase involved in cell wall biosynthesis
VTPLRFLHVFSTFAIGGPQVRFAQLANRFASEDAPPIEHLICAMDGRLDALAKLAPGVRHRTIPPPPTGGSLLSTVASFRRALTSEKPDLLLTYNWGAIEWSMANLACGLAEVHFEDGFGPDEATAQLRRRVLTRRLVLRFRAITVLPSNVLVRHAQTLWRLPSSRTVYIPNGIDCARFSGGGRATAPANDDGSVVIGTVAALRPEKNLGRLLQAFAALPREPAARLVIVGDGPERAALEAMAADLGIKDRVTFAGHCERPETALAGFDIFALSSDTEQMPISLVEAMAAGLPVAAVEVGDVAEMVAEANRQEIVPLEADALAKALARLIGAPAHRQKLGQANQVRARELFDEGLMVDRYADLFKRAMGRTIEGGGWRPSLAGGQGA